MLSKKVSFILWLLAISSTLPAQLAENSTYSNRILGHSISVDNTDTWADDVTIENMQIINTEHLEFSPVYYENGIVYVTSQKETARVDKNIGEAFFELYYAELNPGGFPIHPEGFSSKINTRLHEGPVTFNKDFSKVFFTRNNIIKGEVETGKKGFVRLKIFEGRKGKEEWKDIRELSFNSDDYSCIHPTLSPDEQTLYFASNMPGGYGGYDLYRVQRSGKFWGKPQNLGPDINSDKNDAFPSMHKNGTLFFASQGHNSMGGYDIVFINTGENARPPLKVTNLGRPFNSTADDLGFSLHREGKKGFFTSARSGGIGKDDIYRFDAPNGIPGVSAPEKIEAIIAVYDVQTNEPIPNAEIRMFRQSADGLVAGNNYYDARLTTTADDREELLVELVRRPANRMGRANLNTDERGDAKITLEEGNRYVFVASKDKYITEEVFHSTIGESDMQYIKIGLNGILEKLPEPPIAIVEPPLIKGTVIILDKIFYDFDKSAIRRGAAVDLRAFAQKMLEYPDMKIELSAHTDSRGSSEYNLELSQKRAESAKRFLMARGIAPDRIKTLGYGESRPRNACTDGVKCSEVEHQYNRRTEIRVLEVGQRVDVEYIDNAPEKIDKAPKKVRN